MTKFAPLDLLPLGSKLGSLVMAGLDYYASARAAGQSTNAELLTVFLLTRMEGWDPVVAGRHVLADSGTRDAFARTVAGIAFALAVGV